MSVVHAKLALHKRIIVKKSQKHGNAKTTGAPSIYEPAKVRNRTGIAILCVP